jgi:hypothetical protein
MCNDLVCIYVSWSPCSAGVDRTSNSTDLFGIYAAPVGMGCVCHVTDLPLTCTETLSVRLQTCIDPRVSGRKHCLPYHMEHATLANPFRCRRANLASLYVPCCDFHSAAHSAGRRFPAAAHCARLSLCYTSMCLLHLSASLDVHATSCCRFHESQRHDQSVHKICQTYTTTGCGTASDTYTSAQQSTKCCLRLQSRPNAIV